MLSDTLKEIRRRHYLNQSEFAKRIGVSQSAVSQWEHDMTRPNSYQLQAISKAFNISVDELLQDQPQEQDIKLSGAEFRLVMAFRKADRAICEAALTMLENSASKKSAEAV